MGIAQGTNLNIKRRIIYLAVLGHCCCTGFSLVVESGGYSLAVVGRLLIVVAALVAEHGLGHVGLRSCSTWAQYLLPPGSRAQAQQLWHTGFIAPQHVGSSRIRNWLFYSLNLLKNKWYTWLCKFKAYSRMVWLMFIVKRLTGSTNTW